MAQNRNTIRGSLTNAEETLVLDTNEYQAGAAVVQYGAGGLGTIVLEATVNGTDYVALKMTNPTTKADVDNLAAAGVAWAEVVGYDKVRVRKSVAGAGPVAVVLMVSR
jgi:hypothetical protein